MEDNKALVRRYFEARNHEDWSVFDELIASDFVRQGEQPVRGREAFKWLDAQVGVRGVTSAGRSKIWPRRATRSGCASSIARCTRVRGWGSPQPAGASRSRR